MAASGDVILFTFLLHAWLWSGEVGRRARRRWICTRWLPSAERAVGGEKPWKGELFLLINLRGGALNALLTLRFQRTDGLGLEDLAMRLR